MKEKYPYLTQCLQDIAKRHPYHKDYEFQDYVKIPMDLIKHLFYRFYRDYNVAVEDELWMNDTKRKFLSIAREDVNDLELLMRHAYFEGRLRQLTNADYAVPPNVWLTRRSWEDKKFQHYPFVYKDGKFKLVDRAKKRA